MEIRGTHQMPLEEQIAESINGVAVELRQVAAELRGFTEVNAITVRAHRHDVTPPHNYVL
jgi:hypothetical protein